MDGIRIHNFYVDLLLSLRHLFDDVIFGKDAIGSFQFNIGNRTLQLNYETQFELPAVIVNYQTSRPHHYHTYVIKQHWMKNHSKFPVLFDKTKELILELQEEMYETTLDVVINCESQMQAIDLHHRLTTVLPLNKYLQLHHFYSYYELTENYLTSALFDVNYDEIENLFVKYNNLTDKMEHCFSVRHEPIVRLDDSNVSISSQEQRSFGIQSSMTVLMGVPIYIEIPAECRPAYSKYYREQEIEVGSVSIPTGSHYVLQLNEKHDDFEKIKTYPLLIDSTSFFDTNYYDCDDNQLRLSGRISKYIDVGDFNTTINGEDIVTTCTLTKIMESSDAPGNIVSYSKFAQQKVLEGFDPYSSLNEITVDYKCLLTGSLSGHITDYELQKKRLKGYLYGWKDDTEYNGLIDGQFQLKTSNAELDESFFERKTSNGYEYVNPRVLTYGDVSNNIDTVTVNRLQLIPQKSKLSGIKVILNDSELVCHTLDEEVYLDDYGNFICTFSFIHTCDVILRTSETNSIVEQRDVNIVGNIKGKINKNTLLYKFEISKQTKGIDYDIYELVFDLNFSDIPKYGLKRIQSISIDTDMAESPITTGIRNKLFMDRYGRDITPNKRIYRTILIGGHKKELENIIHITDEKEVYIKVLFDEGFNYDELSEDHKLEWRFIMDDHVFVESPSLELCERTDGDYPYILVFKWDYDLYSSVFRRVALDKTLFFELYERL